MKFFQNPIFGFTSRAPSRVFALENKILISEACDPSSGNPLPAQKEYRAIWDTGATATVITKAVVDGLGLQPSGKVTVQGVGPAGMPAQHLCDTYLVNIYLPNNVAIMGVRVSENSLAGCDVLIGMDIIGEGDFAITNHEGRTTWTFRTPSCEEIDFVAEINEHNQRFGRIKTPLSFADQRKLRNKQKAQRRKNR